MPERHACCNLLIIFLSIKEADTAAALDGWESTEHGDRKVDVVCAE